MLKILSDIFARVSLKNCFYNIFLRYKNKSIFPLEPKVFSFKIINFSCLKKIYIYKCKKNCKKLSVHSQLGGGRAQNAIFFMNSDFQDFLIIQMFQILFLLFRSCFSLFGVGIISVIFLV